MTPRRARPVLRVRLRPHDRIAVVSGWRAKELIVYVGGRPDWSPSRRGWCTQAKHVPELLALAEVEGYAVRYNEDGDAG